MPAFSTSVHIRNFNRLLSACQIKERLNAIIGADVKDFRYFLQNANFFFNRL